MKHLNIKKLYVTLLVVISNVIVGLAAPKAPHYSAADGVSSGGGPESPYLRGAGGFPDGGGAVGSPIDNYLIILLVLGLILGIIIKVRMDNKSSVITN